MDIIDFQEERRPLRAPPCPATEIPCSNCGRPLIKDEFVLGFRLMCDNYECHLFRQGQRIELKSRSKSLAHFNNLDGYLAYIKKRSENYYQLRSMGFKPRFAKCFQSTKQTERITKLVERGVSPEFIVANLQ